MSQALDRPAGPVAVATADERRRDPGLLDSLPLSALIDLRQQAGRDLADLDAAILKRLGGVERDNGPRRVLTVKEAATRLRTSEDSLYRKHRTLRLGYLDPLDRKLKFTEEELDRYVARLRRTGT